MQRNIKQPNEIEYDMGDDVANPYPSQAQRDAVDKSINQPPARDDRVTHPRYNVTVGKPAPWAPSVDTSYLRPAATNRLRIEDGKIRERNEGSKLPPDLNSPYFDVSAEVRGAKNKESGAVYYLGDNNAWKKTTVTRDDINGYLNSRLVIPLGDGNWIASTSFDAIMGSSRESYADGGGDTQNKVWRSVPKVDASLTYKIPGGWGRLGVGGNLDPYTGNYNVSAGGKLKFNRGGTMALQEQMSMFNDGGMLDEGNTIDAVSGNRVPVGSLQEEVRDDVSAQVSAGEYVVPADVVRYFGLEFFMQLRDKAKHGLARMEDIGQMGNAEEAPLEADSPFAQNDTVLVMGNSADSEPIRARGGSYVPTAEELGDVPAIRAQGGSYIPTAEDLGDFPAISAATGAAVPTGWKSPAASGNPNANSLTPLYSHTVNYTNDEGLIKVVAVDTNGKPMYGVPPGYKPPASTPMAPANITAPTPVIDQSNESGASGVGDVGDSSGGKSVGEMSPAEQAAYAQEMKDMPDWARGLALGVGNFMTSAALGKGLMTSIGAGVFGKLSGTKLDFVTDLATTDYNKALEMLEKSKNDPAAFNKAVADHTAAVADATEVAVKGLSVAAKAAALSKAFGATSTQVLTHAQAVSSGNAPAGSSANSFGGYSTTGTQGHSTNSAGDVVGAAAAAQAQTAHDLGISMTQQQKDDVSVGVVSKSLQAQIDYVDMQTQTQDTSVDDDMVSGPVGGMPGSNEQSDDTGTASGATGPEGGLGATTARGGLIQRPKRKAKNTKKKRRGLASR